jgi:hypothetical protein
MEDLTLPPAFKLSHVKRAQAAVSALLARGEIDRKQAYNYNTSFKNLLSIFASKTIQDAEKATVDGTSIDVGGLAKQAERWEREHPAEFTGHRLPGGGPPSKPTHLPPNPSQPREAVCQSASVGSLPADNGVAASDGLSGVAETHEDGLQPPSDPGSSQLAVGHSGVSCEVSERVLEALGE